MRVFFCFALNIVGCQASNIAQKWYWSSLNRVILEKVPNSCFFHSDIDLTLTLMTLIWHLVQLLSVCQVINYKLPPAQQRVDVSCVWWKLTEFLQIFWNLRRKKASLSYNVTLIVTVSWCVISQALNNKQTPASKPKLLKTKNNNIITYDIVIKISLRLILKA